MEFFTLHTLVIGAKALKEFGDIIKSWKNLCLDNQPVAIAPKHKRTCTSPYDNG
jgi:hypothetical protein